MMMMRKRLFQMLLLVGLLGAALTHSACEATVGVGVSYGYPGAWGGPWGGPYGGRVYY